MIFLRKICQRLCEAVCTNQMPPIISGIVLSDASARRQSFISMITTTPMTVIISGTNVVTTFTSTSRSEFTSPMILARIFPVGLLSKKENDSV